MSEAAQNSPPTISLMWRLAEEKQTHCRTRIPIRVRSERRGTVLPTRIDPAPRAGFRSQEHLPVLTQGVDIFLVIQNCLQMPCMLL
jgi:hypothetical protein